MREGHVEWRAGRTWYTVAGLYDQLGCGGSPNQGGGHDLSTPLVSRTLVEGIAGAREVVLEDSSHMPVLEETERYLAVVRKFLHETEERAARR